MSKKEDRNAIFVARRMFLLHELASCKRALTIALIVSPRVITYNIY